MTVAALVCVAIPAFYVDSLRRRLSDLEGWVDENDFVVFDADDDEE